MSHHPYIVPLKHQSVYTPEKKLRTSDMLFWTHSYLSLALHFKCWILCPGLYSSSAQWFMVSYFCLVQLENLPFFIQIICWAPWSSQGQSTALMQFNQTCLTRFFFFLKRFFLHKQPLFSSIIVSIFISHYSPLSQRKVTGKKHRQNLSVARKETILNWNDICSEAKHLKPQLLNLLLMVNFPLIITLGLEFQARDDKRN